MHCCKGVTKEEKMNPHYQHLKSLMMGIAVSV